MDGVRVSVKLIRDASLILPHDGKESASRACFAEIMRENGIEVFFDIGANVGSYSWTALGLGVPEILLFEPDATNQRLLRKTIEQNQLTNCRLIPCAMSDDIGTADFLVDPVSGATGSLEDDRANASSLHHAYRLKQTISVPTVSLDAFIDFGRHKRVMLKIDVEGAEHKVIAGGLTFFKEVRPNVLIECFQIENLQPLIALGYTVQPIQENHNYLLRPSSISD